LLTWFLRLGQVFIINLLNASDVVDDKLAMFCFEEGIVERSTGQDLVFRFGANSL